MSSRPAADVVIVGGGIVGCLIAYYLAMRGLKPVVVEADGIASGASGTSGGWLTPYSHSCDPAMLALSPASLALHRELAETLPELTGIDHGFQELPYLRCALTEQGADELREWRRQRASEGVEMPWLSGDEARTLTPWLTEEIVGAVRSDVEPTVDSYRLTVSALQAAEKGGAEVVSGRAVGLTTEPGDRGGTRSAVDVVLENGTEVTGGAVLIAMGPWSGEAADWLGMPLPITPQRGQMVYLEPPEPDEGPDLEVGLMAMDTGGSILRKRLSNTVVAATQEEVGFDRSTTPEARDWLLERASKLSARVMTARISDQTACLRPITPDGKPYVGRAPGWSNVYIAAGHASEGIYYSPVTAKALAGLIADGRSEHDISALDPARVLDD